MGEGLRRTTGVEDRQEADVISASNYSKKIEFL